MNLLRERRVHLLPGRAHELDLELFRRVAESETPMLDRVLPRLSRAANKSALWMGIAAVLWLSESRRGRRAALRGMLSLTATATIVNAPVKLLARTQRPSIDDVPVARRLAKLPVSSSFPSGHSASAFAFATGATIEMPALGAPLGLIASGVAYSRVYTGVHYPGDVLAGALIGSAFALASRSFWPVAPTEAAEVRRARTPADARPSPDGEGLTIAVNLAAGSALAVEPTDELRDRLPRAKVEEVEIRDGSELARMLEVAADSAQAIGIAGGDGSINCAARIAFEKSKPLVVVPGGTLNHLARDLGLDSVDDAVRAVKEGQAVAVDLASIDGRPFLNTASFGSYVDLVDAREKLEKRIGKWPAVVVALINVLRRSRPVDVEIDGRSRKVWMIFIGNCRYHPSGFAPSWRERLDDGNLDIRIIDGTAPWARTRLIFAVITGRLGRSRVYEQRLARELRVRSLDGTLRLARDGEVFDGAEEFTVTKQPGALAVYVPLQD